jgi:RNA polymerase sigma factor (sigma-70 family)
MENRWSRIRLPLGDARSFDSLVLPHLSAGYNLARWLLRDDLSAEDAVQEAAMRAFRHFYSFRGDDARNWFLGIVRNTCFTYLRQSSVAMEQTGLEEDEIEFLQAAIGEVSPDPAQIFDRLQERTRVNAAIRALPPYLREVIVLRELEDLDYADIARVAGIAIGTVMSRLSRARARLRIALAEQGLDQ